MLRSMNQVPDHPPRQRSSEPEDDPQSEQQEDFLQSLSEEIDALKEDARKILHQRLQLIRRRKALLNGQRKVPLSPAN
jgi:hypothetical protein